MPDESTVTLLARVQSGDPTAAEELFDLYVQRLVRLAQQNMSAKLRQRTDPEDVVNSAFGSFFRRSRDDAFELQRSGDLWRLLAAITVNKVRRQARHHRAEKRSMEAEANHPLYLVAPEMLATAPTPAEAAILVEELERVHALLSRSQQQILQLRGQGLSIAETAAEVDCTERTVYRAEERYEELLRARLDL